MFNAIPIKIPMTFLTVIEGATLKFIWKYRTLQINEVILKKKIKLEVSQYLPSNHFKEL
jgi:hypothetical protein